MTISQPYVSSGTVSTTEYSLPNVGNYSAANAITTDGVYQMFIGVNNIASGDQFQFKIYEKVYTAGPQYVVYQADLVGPQSPPVLIFPSLVLVNGWDVTIKKITGTDRSFTWSIRSVA